MKKIIKLKSHRKYNNFPENIEKNKSGLDKPFYKTHFKGNNGSLKN